MQGLDPNCDRCGKPRRVHVMSFFNTEDLCLDCVKIERKHPDYAAAHEAESRQVLAGNYSYSGVGLPVGYREWAKDQTPD